MNLSSESRAGPQEAIREHLRLYSPRLHHIIPDLTTLQFLKRRSVPTHQVHYVTFQDITGQHWYFICFLSLHKVGRRANSWFVQCMSGGQKREPDEPTERHAFPWVQLKGVSLLQPLLKEFYIYGEVIDKGFHITRIRLLSPNGLILEDTAQDDLVFFWSERQAVYPLQFELYTAFGELAYHQTEYHPFSNSPTIL